jgi:hypothetical protein
MSVIRRNVTRTILNSTETTKQTDTPSSDALTLNIGTSDAFYIGFKAPFASRYFHLSSLNAVSNTLSVYYYNGTTWTAVTDLVDQTVGLTVSGFISWTNETDWKKSTQSPVAEELYWIKIVPGATLTSTTALQAVLNLFCDEPLLRAYYPELVTDTRYLPDSRTDFLEQYVAAKDLVVTRLKQDKLITDESQIIDINEVAISAVHATAWVILNPLARTTEERERVGAIWDQFNKELNEVPIDIDTDNSGTIDEEEKEIGQVFKARG